MLLSVLKARTSSLQGPGMDPLWQLAGTSENDNESILSTLPSGTTREGVYNILLVMF